MSLFELRISRKHACIAVNGNTVGGRFAIDYHDLVKSATEPGEYFIFTCGCGEPGCTGIFQSVLIEHEKGKIYWQIPEPPPESWYSFDAGQYRAAIEKGLDSILAILSPNRPDSCFGPYGSTRAGFIELREKIRRRSSSAG